MDWNGDAASRWRRRALWACGLYAAFAAIGWKAVPWTARRAFAQAPAALPGFSVAADEVAFNPFTLRLRIAGLSLRHEKLKELASCRELSVALNPFALLRLAVGLREIKLTDPKLTVVIAENGSSVLDALPKTPERTPSSSGPGFVPRVVIGAFEVSGGALEFESRLPSAPQKVSVRPIEFRLENLSTIPNDGGRYSLQARTNRSERLLWEGELTVRPARLSGRVAVENVDLTRVSTAAPASPVAFDAGRASASSEYEVSFASGVLTAALKNARAEIGGALWRLKGAPEKSPRGPFALVVGPARIEATAAAMGTPEGKITFRADVPVERTGAAHLRAFATPHPPTGGAEFEIDALPLAAFSPLTPPPTQLTVDGGTLTARGRADYAAGEVEGEASVSVTDFKVSDKASGGVLLKFGRFAVETAKLSTKKRSVEVAAVRLENPFLRLARDKKGKTNVEAAAGISFSTGTTAASPPPAAAAPGPAWKAQLKRFALSGGRVLVQDDAVAPPFALNVSAARVDVAGLANDARSTATFSAAAQVERAPVSAAGTLRLSTAAAWGEAKIAGKGLQLPVFSAYSGKYAGYKIDKGSFGFDLDHKIDGRAIATQNRAVIDQMTFGEKVESPDAIKAPVKLGLAVLKDRNGVIDLSVPVDGSLDDPDFHVAGAVIKTLLNLVVKAALSPFSALSAMAGSKDDLGQLAFAPGGAALTAPLDAQLDKVAKILADKPEMLVGVRGSATRADSLGRGDEELLRRLRGKEPGTAPLTPKEEARVLSLRRELLGSDAASPAQARADIDAQWRGGDAEMRTLALARAGVIKDALAARGVAAERFFSLEPVSGAAAPDEPSRLQLDVR